MSARPSGWARHAHAARFGRRRLLVERLLEEFEAEGKVAIARARAMRPTTYLKLAACLIGREETEA